MILSTGARGVDYAFGRPTPEQLLRNGYTFVVRYISVPPADPRKNITAAERDTLLDGGLAILLVWEISTSAPNQGAPRGQVDGALAKQKALAIGYPQHVPILVAVDTDTWLGNISAHHAYVRAFADACFPYPIGVYGDADILLRVGTLSKIGWLPNASAWSTANRQKAIDAGLVHVLQRKGYGMEGIAVDPNDVIQPIHSWSKVHDHPLPPPIQQENDMLARVRFEGHKNVFGNNGGSYSHLSNGLDAAFALAPMVLVTRDELGYDAALKCALGQTHLAESDLEPMPGE